MWLKKLFDRIRGVRTQRQNDGILLTLPSGHRVRLTREDYDLYLGGEYIIVWKYTDRDGFVVNWRDMHLMQFSDVMAWTGRSEERIATGIRTDGAWGIHPYPTKKQTVDPDRLPYDPRLGF